MGTWSGPDDAAAERFLAEHGMAARFADDELVIEAGNEGLLPAWPSVITPKDDGPAVPSEPEVPEGSSGCRWGKPTPRSDGPCQGRETTPEGSLKNEASVHAYSGTSTPDPPPTDLIESPHDLIASPPVLCAVCQTPVARHGDAGWRHEVSLAERGGCVLAWPEG